jgi:hypothetical protein
MQSYSNQTGPQNRRKQTTYLLAAFLAAPEASPVDNQSQHLEPQPTTPISDALAAGISDKPLELAEPHAAVPPYLPHSATDPPIAPCAREQKIVMGGGTSAISAYASYTISLRTLGGCSCVWLASRVTRHGRGRGRRRVRRTGSPVLRR